MFGVNRRGWPLDGQVRRHAKCGGGGRRGDHQSPNLGPTHLGVGVLWPNAVEFRNCPSIAPRASTSTCWACLQVVPSGPPGGEQSGQSVLGCFSATPAVRRVCLSPAYLCLLDRILNLMRVSLFMGITRYKWWCTQKTPTAGGGASHQ